jgi:hypothetical protein
MMSHKAATDGRAVRRVADHRLQTATTGRGFASHGVNPQAFQGLRA